MRNLERAAAVEVGLALDVHHVRDVRHGGGSARGKEDVVQRVAFLEKFGLARAAVGGHAGEAPRRIHEAFDVQRVELVGQFPEHEVEAEGAFVAEEGAQAEIALVVPEGEGAAGRAAYLPGNIADAVERPGRNAHRGLQVDVGFHQGVHNAHAVRAAQGAAFQHEAARGEARRGTAARKFSKA